MHIATAGCAEWSYYSVSSSLVWLWHLSAYCREKRADSTQMSSTANVCPLGWACVCRYLCECVFTLYVCYSSVFLYLRYVFIQICTMHACVHLPFSVLHRSVFVSLYIFHLSWHAKSSVWRCEMWEVASDRDLSCSNIQVWDLFFCRINLRWKRSAL